MTSIAITPNRIIRFSRGQERQAARYIADIPAREGLPAGLCFEAMYALAIAHHAPSIVAEIVDAADAALDAIVDAYRKGDSI